MDDAGRRDFIKATTAAGVAGAGLLSLWPRDLLAGISQDPASAAAMEAYVFGYPLVTVEHTEAGSDECRLGRRTARTNQPARECTVLSRRVVQGRYRTQRRYAVQLGVSRPHPRAHGPEPSRHGRPLLPLSHARRLDQRLPGARQAHHRRQGPGLCHHRAGLEGHASRRCHRVQGSHAPWHGSSAGSTAPARRRTTRPCMRCRTSSGSCHSATTASLTRRRPAR